MPHGGVRQVVTQYGASAPAVCVIEFCIDPVELVAHVVTHRRRITERHGLGCIYRFCVMLAFER
jgi:hypothetical protein